MTTPVIRLAHERVSEAAILLAAGAPVEQIAEALLRALDELEALEHEMGGAGGEMKVSSS